MALDLAVDRLDQGQVEEEVQEEAKVEAKAENHHIIKVERQDHQVRDDLLVQANLAL